MTKSVQELLGKPAAYVADATLIEDAKVLFDAFVEKLNELAARRMYVTFQLNNGTDGTPVRAMNFKITKDMPVPGEVIPALEAGPTQAG